MASSSVLNFNVGVLGHVDSGKTSLAKAISTVSSTAAFDKNPQSQVELWVHIEAKLTAQSTQDDPMKCMTRLLQFISPPYIIHMNGANIQFPI